MTRICGTRRPRALLRSLVLSTSSLALLFVLSDDAHGQRSARAVRTKTPPTIDGVLSDEVWGAAPPLEELFQITPIEGTPSERTEIRILFDSEHIYFALRMFDSDPSGIIATTHERDASLNSDDRIEFVIDTFLDRRNAYSFQMNAAGSKGDALISDGGRDINKPWDGIWEGKATIDAEGWSAEMAIPFKTLSFKEGLGTWGFNLLRYIGRRNERARWNNPNRDADLFSMAQAGEITGLEGLEQGLGLDVVPFFVSSWSLDRTGGGDSDLIGDPGVDAFYKITPNLTLSLTLNTDFAETEVDERQINLTRFPLFFPERRDFFLQDAGLFSFGGGTGPLPFFSRTIGLSDGMVVPLIAGAKLTGRVGDYNVGVLDVQTDESDIAGGENLFVTRISKNVGEQSSIGAILTNGNPAGTGDNTVFGIDAGYRSNDFRGDKNLDANVWALVSSSEGVDNDDGAYGASIGSPNDRWSWFAQFEEIQANFNPALGFVPRSDVRRYSGEVAFEPRIDEKIRQLEITLYTEVITDTDDVLETWFTEAQPFGIEWDSGDTFRIEFEHVHDELREDFEISDGVTIPGGAYDYDLWRLEFDSARKRPVSTRLAVSGGSFYDGDRTSYRASVNYRVAPVFTGSVEYNQNDIDLDGGSFSTQIGRVRSRFSFSPNLSWNTFIQWDNVSETFGINSRVRWIPTPGQEVFFVFNETLDENRDSLIPLYEQVAFKIAYTIRF